MDDGRRDQFRGVACNRVDDAVDEGSVIERQRRQIVALHREHLASVRMVTDISGNTVEGNSYATYGESLNTGFHTQKGYIGERFDAETGLLYLNARYMDPVLGRFISPDDWDPTKEGVGTNRYAYACNDPINRGDNNGHIAPLIWAAAILGAYFMSVEPANAPAPTDTAKSVSGGQLIANMAMGAATPLLAAKAPFFDNVSGGKVATCFPNWLPLKQAFLHQEQPRLLE